MCVYRADDPYNVRYLARLLGRTIKGEHWHFSSAGGSVKYRGMSTTARRIVWALTHGEPVPDNHNVTVTCDELDCIKPDHLAPERR